MAEAHEGVVPLALRLVVVAAELALDEVDREVVLERDEVAAWAVERVGERAGLADGRPAVAEELLGAIGQLLVAPDVEELGALEELGRRCLLYTSRCV